VRELVIQGNQVIATFRGDGNYRFGCAFGSNNLRSCAHNRWLWGLETIMMKLSAPAKFEIARILQRQCQIESNGTFRIEPVGNGNPAIATRRLFDIRAVSDEAVSDE
jgi:hypothetical protein